jgi:hypothetical protein
MAREGGDAAVAEALFAALNAGAAAPAKDRARVG